MSDAATETEQDQPEPLPESTRRALQMMLDAGNTAHVDERERIVAGTPDKPGEVLPCDASEMLLIACRMLIAGERTQLLTTTRGRHYARIGSMDGYDGSVTDVDLAAWAKGTIDYTEAETLAAIEAYHFRVALTRAEALEILINLGVAAAGGARTDV